MLKRKKYPYFFIGFIFGTLLYLAGVIDNPKNAKIEYLVLSLLLVSSFTYLFSLLDKFITFVALGFMHIFILFIPKVIPIIITLDLVFMALCFIIEKFRIINFKKQVKKWHEFKFSKSKDYEGTLFKNLNDLLDIVIIVLKIIDKNETKIKNFKEKCSYCNTKV